MKLHVGCGKRYISGWTNVDILEGPTADIIDDAKTLKTIEDSSCDMVYACHILEHFGRHEFKDILKVWYTKLCKGGTLRLSVPDFDKVIDVYKKTDDIEMFLGFLVGGQKDEYDFHNMIFNYKLLSEVLLGIGFKNIKRWDWRTVEHSEVDDYSQAYLPHMDKENGTLMSLNIECTK